MNEQAQQDRSFRQLLDAAPDAVVIVDRFGQIVMVNREVERLFGWTEHELLGRLNGLLIPPRFQRALEAEPVSGAESQSQPAVRKGVAVSLLARRRAARRYGRPSGPPLLPAFGLSAGRLRCPSPSLRLPHGA